MEGVERYGEWKAGEGKGKVAGPFITRLKEYKETEMWKYRS